jgi:aminomethyltransferase
VTAEGLKRTPLYGQHRRLGARMVEFGGWEMPVQYRGILEEHRAVRTDAGVFDVSHMGEFRFRGAGALDLLQRLITNDAAALAVGQALYTPMCYPDGGTVDDCVVYRTGGADYLMVVNAANIERDLAWVREAASAVPDSAVEDRSAETALLAVQGPRAAERLGPLTDAHLASLPRFGFVDGVRVAGVRCLVARTGYTGEDGFELFCQAEEAPHLWEAVLDQGVQPCGLGARDTLRLEAALPLYGHELSPEINPLEARLAPFVKFEKGDFLGRDALLRVKAEGPRRRLAGLVLAGRAVARQGHRVLAGGRPVGSVTSGTFSPTLGRPVALALVEAELARPGEALAVEIRGREAPAEVVRLPFYRRQG